MFGPGDGDRGVDPRSRHLDGSGVGVLLTHLFLVDVLTFLVLFCFPVVEHGHWASELDGWRRILGPSRARVNPQHVCTDEWMDDMGKQRWWHLGRFTI